MIEEGDAGVELEEWLKVLRLVHGSGLSLWHGLFPWAKEDSKVSAFSLQLCKLATFPILASA
jgi:hypothetical protein